MDDSSSEIKEEGKGEINYQEGFITLPFSKKQFRDFMSGLFGKPEIISREYENSFEIELNDIYRSYILINHKAYEAKNKHYKYFLKQYKNTKVVAIVTVIATISINILSNYVFWLLSEKYL